MVPFLPQPYTSAAEAWTALEAFSSSVTGGSGLENGVEGVKFEGFLSREVVGDMVALSGSFEGESAVMMLSGSGAVTVRSRSEGLRKALLRVITYMV